MSLAGWTYQQLGRIKPALLLLSTALVASPVHSSEGFHTSIGLLPQAQRTAWQASFLVLPVEDGGIGSAVMVAKQKLKSSRWAIWFLTSGHTIRQNCNMKFRLCKNIILSQSLAYNVDTDEVVRTDKKKISFTGAFVDRRSDNPDLALLRVVVSNQSPLSKMNPVQLPKYCPDLMHKPVYVIGFPNLRLRSASFKFPFLFGDSHPELTLRRWSFGYGVEPSFELLPDDTMAYYYDITADALQGSSGGAVTNSEGELVGILAGALESEDFSYMGREFPLPMQHHARMIRCEYLKDFIAGRPLSFNPELRP